MSNKAIGMLTMVFGADLRGFDKAMKKAQRKIGRFGKSMEKVGSSLTRSITLPVIGIGAAAVKSSADFGTALTKIRTLVGATASEVDDYRKSILKLSSETGTSATQLADGLFFITSAGLEGAEAMETLEIAAKSSAMGMGEMSDISNALTSIMVAYADSNMTSAKAGDLLHETLKQGKMEAGEFMSRLGKILPTSAAAGISFEELGSAVATMSKVSGDAAGTLTSINQVMMKLLNPSEQQKEILSDLNMSYEDLQGMLGESLMGTLQHLFTELEGNDEALMKVFGSSKAVTGALATMGLQSKTYTEVLDGMKNSTDNVANGFNILEEDAGFKMQKALNDLKIVLIDLGDMVMPIVLKGIQKVRDGFAFFINLPEDTKKIITTFGLVAAAIGPILTVAGKLTTAFSNLIPLFAAISLPLIKAVIILGTLVAAFLFVRENFDALKERMSDWSWWKNALITAVQFVIKINPFNVLIKGFNKLAKALGMKGIGNPFTGLSDKLEDLRVETKKYDNDIVGFGQAMKNQAAKIKKSFTGLFDNFKIPGLGGGSGGGGGNGKKDEPLLPGDPIGDSEPIVTLYTSANEELKKTTSLIDILNDKFGISKDVIKGYGEQLGSTLSQGAESFSGFVDQLKNGIRETISALLGQAIAGAISNALRNSTMFAGPFGLAMIPVVAGLASGLVKTAFNSLIPSFAKGGIVSGPTTALVGDNIGAGRGNPEVIAPLNKLRGMIGGGSQHVVVTGRLSGNDIFLANERTGMKRFRSS